MFHHFQNLTKMFQKLQKNLHAKKNDPLCLFQKFGKVLRNETGAGVTYTIKKNNIWNLRMKKATICRRFLISNKIIILVNKIPLHKNVFHISFLKVSSANVPPTNERVLYFNAQQMIIVRKSVARKISRKYQIKGKFLKYLKNVPTFYSGEKLLQASSDVRMNDGSLRKCQVKVKKIDLSFLNESDIHKEFCLKKHGMLWKTHQFPHHLNLVHELESLLAIFLKTIL